MDDSETKRYQAAVRHVPESATDVLHIGCARHSAARREEASLFHHLRAELDATVLGIDVLESEIEQMRAEGYNVQVGDAEQLDFDREFDAIVAGELIEHLPNPGQFLQRAEAVLAADGRLVLTTPNPDGFAYWRKALAGQQNNPTHTCWIDPDNLAALVDAAETGLEIQTTRFLPPVGGLSGVLWRFGRQRAASAQWVAVLG